MGMQGSLQPDFGRKNLNGNLSIISIECVSFPMINYILRPNPRTTLFCAF